MKRENWGSRLGFVLAVSGSAIGLANIWRFPYMVGKNGGAAFLFIYLFCLALVGFPVFISEILIGKKAQASPGLAFLKLGGSRLWGNFGRLTILTGFLVSTFYSAVAGWVLGYFIEAIRGQLVFHNPQEAAFHFVSLVGHPAWGLTFHFLFMVMSIAVLYLGVKNGIEKVSKILMPLLFVILIGLLIKGLSLPNSFLGIEFLLKPDWTVITPLAILGALGHSFFTLSLGQGTMVTYGSYLGKSESVLKSCIPVLIMDTFVSLMAAFTIFTISFSQGVEPDAGAGLIFQTLPLVFSDMAGGQVLAFLFFLLVVIAALTSQISAMEPSIAFLMEEKKWGRHKATLSVGILGFLIGIPAALSSSLLKNLPFSFLEMMDTLCNSILIPFGGFIAVALVGWFWGFTQAYADLSKSKNKFLRYYFLLGIKYTAPILIVLIFLNATGMI